MSYLREIGADEVIDYNTTDFTKAVTQHRRGVRDRRRGRGDAILRGAQARRPRGLHRVRAEGAGAGAHRRHVACGRSPPATARISIASPRSIQAGVVRPPEVKLYKLSDAAEAHRVSEARHLRGKLVFKVR